MQRIISDERKRRLSCIAEDLCNNFINVFEAAAQEDDCVEPIHQALSLMDDGENFYFPRKLGIVLPSYFSTYLVMLTLTKIGIRALSQVFSEILGT